MARTHVNGHPDWSLPSVDENIAGGEVHPYEFLAENCPDDRMRDVDYILSLMDW